MPKVSVIMGIYNCAPTLQEALDSLYAQTYQDFEIILCDDGSKDNTFQIAYENQQKHSNIVLLKNPCNKGLNQALNNCLAVAKGEYIARMDGDDFCDPTRFEKQVKFLDEHIEYAIVSNPMIYFDENGEFGRGQVRKGEQFKEQFNYATPFCHAPSMSRKEAFDIVGGYSINPWLLRMEDYNLWMKMYAKGFRGYNLAEYLYMMRDDRNASKRRTLRNRINGVYAHYLAYETLHLSFWKWLCFSIVYISKAFVPTFIYEPIHKRKLSSRSK